MQEPTSDRRTHPYCAGAQHHGALGPFVPLHSARALARGRGGRGSGAGRAARQSVGHGSGGNHAGAAGTPLRDLSAASHRRLAQQHPDLAVIIQKAGRFGQRPAWLRGVTLTTGQPAQRVAQLHAFFYAPSQPGRVLSDVISVLGICPEAEAAQHVPQFVSIVGSFEFGTENASGS